MSSRSSDSEEDDYDDEDEDDLHVLEEDELPGRPYDAPTPDPTTPPATADEKGKGRAVDATASTDPTTGAGNPAGQANERVRDRVKDALASLQGIDSNTLDTLVAHDPTPVSALSTSTKLVKAIALLQRQFQESPVLH